MFRVWSLVLPFYFVVQQCHGFHKIHMSAVLKQSTRSESNNTSNHSTIINTAYDNLLHNIVPRGGSEAPATNSNFLNNPSFNENEEFVFPQYSLPKGSEDLNFLDDNVSCTHGLVLMDAFCPYHGGYLSRQAKIAYNAGIVHCVSDYVLNCLLRENDESKDDNVSEGEQLKNQYFNAKIPKKKENLQGWLNAIPFKVSGIICESDSGLDDAEKLGVAMGLEKHDGYNRKLFE